MPLEGRRLCNRNAGLEATNLISGPLLVEMSRWLGAGRARPSLRDPTRAARRARGWVRTASSSQAAGRVNLAEQIDATLAVLQSRLTRLLRIDMNLAACASRGGETTPRDHPWGGGWCARGATDGYVIEMRSSKQQINLISGIAN